MLKTITSIAPPCIFYIVLQLTVKLLLKQDLHILKIEVLKIIMKL